LYRKSLSFSFRRLFTDVVLKYRCNKIVGNKNEAHRSVMKTIFPKQQTLDQSKHVRRDERFLSLAHIDKVYHEPK